MQKFNVSMTFYSAFLRSSFVYKVNYMYFLSVERNGILSSNSTLFAASIRHTPPNMHKCSFTIMLQHAEVTSLTTK